MRWSLPVSFAVHVSILVLAAGVLSDPEAFKVEDQESIPVEIVDISELSKRQATKPDAPKEEKKPGPEVIKEPEITKIERKIDETIKQASREPQPEPEPKPAPAPEPEPVEAKPEPPQPDPVEELIKQTETAEPVPEPEKKAAEAKPVPKPRQKPKPPQKVVEKKKKKKKKDFNPDDVAALLNKIDDDRTAPAPPQDELTAPVQDEIARLVNANDDGVSASELDWLRQRIGRCWNVPAGVRDAHNLVVRVQIQMDPSGNVLGQPVVLNNSSHPAFGAAARSSVAAILGCQPYDKLPAEKYAAWKNIIINFDPSKMLAIN
jgi:hypothetical protein